MATKKPAKKKAKKTVKKPAVKSAKKPAKKARKTASPRGGGVPPPPAAGSARAIRIRMYRVGFGDCFLVSLPTDTRTAHILVDCGVHPQGDLHTIPAIVADIAQETGKNLDLIIASHAHADHISGFSKQRDLFRQFKVGEVWMPWTEDPDDPQANKLRRARTALALSLEQHFAAVGGSAPTLAVQAVQNAVGNADALALLKNGVNGGKVRYLKGGLSFDDTAGIPGLTTKILGPPTDQKFLSVMDPPSGDRYMRLGANGAPEAANAIVPFDHRWAVRPASAPLSADDTKDLHGMLDQSEQLAFTLDSVLNNTSVVAFMTFGGRTMLFPGDAQYGNWQSWMETPDGGSILSHAQYLKIAHHCSHNGTPKSALAKTTPKSFAAHISTQNTPWKTIPFGDILTDLDGKSSGYVRSDSIPLSSNPGAIKGPAYKATPGFTLGPFWSDYQMPL
ncbi:MAG TPA: MBL fold metallo-hydrolase [Rhizomicrobium sp.]|jgi:beta-lactamase superfamily II metal-dependent hydrolase